jgi:hypothetical protein
MVASATQRLAIAYRDAQRDALGTEQLRACVLLHVARSLCQNLGLSSSAIYASRLARLAGSLSLAPQLAVLCGECAWLKESAPRDEAAHRMGEILDLLLAHEGTGERKKTGSYFTPQAVARDLIRRTLQNDALQARVGKSPFRVCDPACGGGAFLIEAARGISQLSGSRKEVAAHFYGTDLSEIALATTEVALWLFVGEETEEVSHPSRFVRGDALLGKAFDSSPIDDASLAESERALRLDFDVAFPELVPHGFDWIVGNPPWVAFQGRATQTITAERRAFYRRNYKAFSGYPTLHGLFVERATKLAPLGHITLLVPSSVADLDGYQATRATLCATHAPDSRLPEYGQDAFADVVQPCFGLIARPGSKEGQASGVWRLEERSHAGASVREVPVPAALLHLEKKPRFLPETFREVGFQSNRRVSTELFYRGSSPPREFSVALLEGRNVGEFVEREPSLFLRPDEDILRQTNCRLKSQEAYAQVDFVVRQTAAFPIAARHRGARFRNSLLGGFATEGISADLLVGLLNSALYRALHVAWQRDARQAAFPQVKLGHLRKLPRPPDDRGSILEKIEAISAEATASRGLRAEQRAELDAAVFEIFSMQVSAQEQVLAFLQERAPAALRVKNSA